ncbi:ANT(4')-I family aminoglycoside nucleotidyltransferase [Shimazuella kribbensis]|uniref:ANT(4')-I family aminoglycoside nucleotidyltransferase n=1 Tax=Shimazuella kribbensis TaxID=139808 RepID=UPI0004070855
MNGPAKMIRSERLKIIDEIKDRIMEKYNSKVKAIGVYGSVARCADGPYSDIEILCVLSTSGESFRSEWTTGNWKAEVDFDSGDVVLEHAETVENDWPLTHGMYVNLLPLYDPDGFFTKVRKVVQSPKKKDFQHAISCLLIEDLFETVGKWRNIHLHGPKEYLPSLAIDVARYGAMLVGLHNKTNFSTSAQVLPEALRLPDRPAGFDALCKLVLSGQLHDSKEIIQTCENFWTGVLDWAMKNNYTIIHSEKIPF